MRYRSGIWCLCFMAVTGSQKALAAEDGKIIRVEEDWVLVVETPDPLQDAPQVSTWMSPHHSLTEDYFGVDFNHAQRSGYDGGGFQTKAMHDATVIDERLLNHGQNLNIVNETVKWTQVLAIDNRKLIFSIKNGSSISWGSFGGSDTEIRRPTSMDNLNSYNPKISCESSGVGYAANRVASLKLSKIRLVTETGQSFEVVLNRDLQQSFAP